MNKTAVYIKLTIAVILWGGSFIATKIALEQIQPVTLVWLRFGMGVAFLGMTVSLRKQLSLPSKGDLPYLALLGLIGITFHQWLQSTGLVTSQASTTAWIVASIPVFTALLGWIVLRERLISVQVFGILLAALGVVLVVSGGDWNKIQRGGFGKPGDLLILISAPNWAVFSVLSRRGLQRFKAAWLMFYVMLFGWIFDSFLLLGNANLVEITHLTATGWMAVGFLGIFCSGVAYVFFYDALEAFPASTVSVFVYLEPLVAMIVSALILNERITGAAMVGGAIILLGVWLVQKNQNRNAKT